MANLEQSFYVMVMPVTLITYMGRLKMSDSYYEENDERMNIIGQNGNDGLHYGKTGESVITDIYVGKYVLVQLVDETVELTVQNNVYSLTESVELQQDLLKALHELRTQNILPEIMIKDIENGS
tara:strand:+ start:362 stop:733 length:372 start_codon:yes stop_codon:yes gene_type:complete